MAKSRKTKSETPRARYWRGRIEKWAGTGLTQAEFCRREGLSLPSFSWWKWELTRRDRIKSQPAFLPVRVVGTAKLDKASSNDHHKTFEIILQQGYRVRVPEHFEPKALLRLLRVLEDSTC